MEFTTIPVDRYLAFTGSDGPFLVMIKAILGWRILAGNH